MTKKLYHRLVKTSQVLQLPKVALDYHHCWVLQHSLSDQFEARFTVTPPKPSSHHQIDLHSLPSLCLPHQDCLPPTCSYLGPLSLQSRCKALHDHRASAVEDSEEILHTLGLHVLRKVGMESHVDHEVSHEGRRDQVRRDQKVAIHDAVHEVLHKEVHHKVHREKAPHKEEAHHEDKVRRGDVAYEAMGHEVAGAGAGEDAMVRHGRHVHPV